MSELCFNLWYYLTPHQTLSGIAAREYLLDGSETEIAEVLVALSEDEFRLVPMRPVSEAISRRFAGGAVPYRALVDFGVDTVFEEVFRDIRVALPSSIPFPEDKLFYATPLYDFGEGFAPAEIENGHIRSR